MFIQTEATPNPATLKFLPGRAVMPAGTLDMRTAEEAATPNLIVTCHAAFCSPEGMVEMRRTSAKIARAAVLGQPIWNRVN